jgi:hypothetical protein
MVSDGTKDEGGEELDCRQDELPLFALKPLPRPERLVTEDKHDHRVVGDNVGCKANAYVRQAISGCFLLSATKIQDRRATERGKRSCSVG